MKKIILGILSAVFMITNVNAETFEVKDEAELKDCFSKESATCILDENITLENQLVVDKGKTIVLELNSKTLNLADYSNYAITVKGNLTIQGDGIVNIPGYYGIGTSVNLGTLTIKGGTYNQAETGYYIFGNWNNLTIEDGTFNSYYCTLNSFEYNGVQYQATVKGGTFIDEDGEYTLLGYVKAEGGTFSHDVSSYVKEGYASRLIVQDYVVGKLYKINVNEVTNGSVIVQENAIAGEIVNIETTPASTYKIKGILVKGTNEVEVKDNEFVMPNEEVTVGVEFEKIITTTLPTIEENAEIKETTVVVEETEKVNETIKNTITNDEKLQEKVKDIEVSVSIEIDEVDLEKLEEKNPEIKKAIEEKAGKAIISDYFDITLDLTNAKNGEFVSNIEELSSKIKMTILLPEKLKNTDKKINREYTVIREHKGVVEVLPAKLSDDGNYIEFESDRFSLYALAYEDTKVKDESTPQTYDEITTYILIGGVSLLALASTCLYIKKRQIN